MEFHLDDVLAILERTPLTLRTLLGGLPDARLRYKTSPDGWSPYDVIGHLIQGEEADWIPRLRVILDEGGSRPFDPFDRFAQFQRFGSQPMEELLDAFAQRREQNLATLRGLALTPEQMALPGIHPALGSVTLGHLLATWAVHDLNHLGQIAEGLAKPYQEAVGPWQAYLDILHR